MNNNWREHIEALEQHLKNLDPEECGEGFHVDAQYHLQRLKLKLEAMED